MTTRSTWILVCDASRARLFREVSKKKGLELLQEMDHAESRAHVRDLMADANGRKPVGPVPAARAGNGHAGNGPGAYGRPGAEPDTDPKEVEAQKFARELAGVLERGLNDHAYDRLVIVAPPHFLGTLRQTVTHQVEKKLEITIDKDLTGINARDLAERLDSSLHVA